jgi:fibronectin-binding autotransporter adhesin
MKTKNLRLTSQIAGLILLSGAISAQAQTQIKAANNTALSTGTSWVSGTAPTSTGIGEWNNVATATGDTITSLAGPFSIGEIQLTNNVAGAVGITDTTIADILTLNGIAGTGLGIDMSLANQNLTLSTPITLGGNQTWNIASGRTMTLSGVNSDLIFGANVLTVTGGGTLDANFPNLPNTPSSSSAGAGLVIIGSTVFATIQEPVSTFHNNVNYFGANTVLTMTPNSTTFSTYELGEVASSGSAEQNFTGLVLNQGTSILTASGRTASSGHTVGFAAITRNGGSLVDVVNNGGTFGAAANSYGLPEPVTGPDTGTSLALGFATASANDWAAPRGATTTTAITAYTADTFTAGIDDNITLTTDSASSGTVNSLRFNTANAPTLTLSGANIINSGGILMGSTLAKNNAIITGGTLTSGNTNSDGTSDLIVINNTASSGNLTINSVITDNGSQSVGLTVGTTSTTTPTGSVQLGGANTFSGTTYVTKGTLLLNNTLALQDSTFNTTLPGVLSFGALTSAALGGLSGSGSLALPKNFALTVGGSHNSTLNGALSGVGASVTKVGGGTLTFNAANKYTGNTTISNGTLALGPSGVYGGTAVISSGATLDVSAAGNYLLSASVSGNGTINGALTLATGGTLSSSGTTGVLTLNSNLTMNGGTLLVNVDAGLNANGVVNIGAGGSGNLNLTSGSVQLNITDGTLANGTYKLIGVPNGTITGAANISVSGFAQLNQVATLVAGAGALNLVVSSYTFQNLTWVGDGAGSGLWNVAGDVDWFDNTSSASSVFNTGDYVTFDNTSPNQTVNLSPPFVSPSSVTVNSASYTFTGNGAISGSAALTNASSGTLTILTTNNNTGGTTINSGSRVQVGNGTLGGAIGSGSVLDNGALVWDLPAGTETMGAASGGGTLTNSGAGTLVLNGADTLAGSTTITSGTLKQGAPSVLPNGVGEGNMVVNGTLDLAGQSATVNGLSGSGIINSSSVGAPIFTVTGSGAFSGPIENTVGTLALVMNGSGQQLELSGADTYSGGTTITAGTLQLGSPGALGSGDVSVATGAILDLNSNSPTIGALNGGGTITSSTTNATLTIGADNNNGTFSGSYINVAGTTNNLAMNGTGTETLTGANTYSGSTTMNAGSLVLPAGGSINGGPLNGNGFVVSGGTITSTGSSSFGQAANTFNESAGTVSMLNCNPSSTGNDGEFVDITGGSFSVSGTFSLGRTANIATATASTPTTAATTSGLYITNVNTLVPSSVALGVLDIGTGNSAASVRMDSGTLTVTNEVEIAIGNGRWSSFEINGGLFTNLDTVNGIVIAQNASSGEAYFNNNSTSYAQKISFGLASDSSAGNGFLYVFNGATLYLGSGGISKLDTHMTTANYGVELKNATLGAMANWSSVLNMSLSGSFFNFQASDSAGNPWTMTLNGVISGPGSLIGTGTGTVILGGADTYTGGTIVSNGIVSFVSGALASTGGGVTLAGGTLQWQPGTADDISAQGITFTSNGTLDVNGNNVTLANSIGNGGTGNLTVASTAANGVLNLTGVNSYAGNTTVASGTLEANSSSATGTGTVTVQSGGTLAGTGTAGNVVINSGGILSPGNTSVGTLTVGTLTMNAGAIGDIEFNGSANDQTVASSLSLSSSVFNLFTAGGTQPWTTPGTYTLITYGGSDPVLDSTWTTSSGSNPHVGNPDPISSYAFSASGGHLILTIVGNPNLNIATWTSTSSGNWSSGPNWNTNPKVPSGAGDMATLGVGTGSGLTTITLDAAESVGGISFTNSNPFDVAAGSPANILTLNNGGAGASIFVLAGVGNTIATPMAIADNTIISVDSGDSLILSGTITNSPSVTKTLAISGAGTTVVSGANSYGPAAGTTGTTLSGGGTLQVGSSTALGAGNLSVTASSTLQAGASVSLANKITTAPSVTLTLNNNANSLVLAGAISGSGALTEIGSGTLALSGINSYTGSTTVSNGVLSLTGNASVAGTPTIDLIGGDLKGNGTLAITPKIGIGSSSLADVGTYTGYLDAASGAVFTVSGVIQSDGNTGTQNLDVNTEAGSTGTVILGGVNTFGAVVGAGAGLTQIYNGLLEVANPLALQNSTLDYNSYGGSLVFAPGTTNATLGALQGAQNLGLTNLAGAGVNLAVNGNDTPTTYSGNLSDGGAGGALTKNGLQTLTLTGTSAFGGVAGLNVNAGVVDLQGSLTCGAVTTSGNGGSQLLVDNSSTLIVTNTTNTCIIGTGSVGLLVQGGTATFTGNLGEPLGNDANAVIDATGGFLSMSNLALGRSGTVYSTQPTTGDTGSGLYVDSGTVVVSNNLNMGTDPSANSTVSVRVDSGSLQVNNTLTISLNNGGRWSVVAVNGGDLTVTNNATNCIAVGGLQYGNAELLIQNGVATVGTVLMGQGGITNNGESAVVNLTGGSLYVGGGGIVAAASGLGFVTSDVQLDGGTLGAAISWTNSVPVELTSTTAFTTIQTADVNGNPDNITFNGGISGPGLLYVSGGNGVLRLIGSETWTGGAFINQGTLAFIGQDSAAGFFQNAGGLTNDSPGVVDVSGLPDQTMHIGDTAIHQVAQSLSGNGSINGSVFIGKVGSLVPGYPVGSVSGFLQIPINNNLTVTNSGAIVLNIDDQGSGPVNDSVNAASVLFKPGSSLVLNQGNNDLVAGDTFQLLNITGHAGLSSATNLVLTLPLLSPDSQYAYVWNTSQLAVNGSITLASRVVPSPVLTNSVAGGVLTLSWANLGTVLQTNSVGLANPNAWFPYPGSSSVTSETITINPGQPQVFFRLMLP